ncbi:hypothetical protein PLICRDRAFT_41053 [Plicaturopsis crispa FD-325 SS-3]|nr:hypothetical protein PLICRDRAFT_41053 [Plicaturopsis crispa FD-325 SS-3]
MYSSSQAMNDGQNMVFTGIGLEVSLLSKALREQPQSPISLLPDEMLEKILFFSQHGASGRPRGEVGEYKLPPLFVFSRVCVRWREVVLGSPRLWSVINIRVWRPDISMSMGIDTTMALRILPMYLERSKACPLDIKLEVSDDPVTGKVMDLLIAHASRWQTLSIASRRWDRTFGVYAFNAMYAALAKCSHSEVPLLEGVQLMADSDIWHIPEASTDYPEHVFTAGAPLLKTLKVSGFAMRHCLPPFSSLGSLEIHSDMSWRWKHFARAISSSPFLSTLSVRGNVTDASWPKNDDASLELPGLQTLSLGIWDSRITYVWRVLSLISAPQLHTVHLHGLTNTGDAFMYSPFAVARPLHFPSLRTLHLDTCELSDSENTNLFRALPSIVSVILEASWSAPVLSLLDPVSLPVHRRHPRGMPWPKLCKIEIRRDGYDARQFRGVFPDGRLRGRPDVSIAYLTD